jgi:hypothetical protein
VINFSSGHYYLFPHLFEEDFKTIMVDLYQYLTSKLNLRLQGRENTTCIWKTLFVHFKTSWTES